MKLRFSFFFFLSLVIHASVVTDGLNLFSSHDPTQAALPQSRGGHFKTTLRLITVPKKNNKTFVGKKNKPSKVKSTPSDIIKAKLKNGFLIEYPFFAKKNKLQGTVVLTVEINKFGVVKKAKIKKPSGHEILDKKALEQILRASFNPKKVNNQNISSVVDVAINFKL